MKGMGLREPLAALQQLPVSPESPRHTSTSQPFYLLMATGDTAVSSCPTMLAPHSGPIRREEKSLQSLSGHSDTLQGYYFPSYRVILIYLAIEELASVKEFIFLWGDLLAPFCVKSGLLWTLFINVYEKNTDLVNNTG